jgi:hypothetical protein
MFSKLGMLTRQTVLSKVAFTARSQLRMFSLAMPT